jgi:hypothetical protein
MAKTAAANGTSSSNGQDFLPPDDLHFDLENPRFIDHQFKNEKEIISFLYDHVDVDELIQSILSAGYVDFEPLIVLKQKQIVLEGNRRLAAIRLISREALRKELKITLPAIDNPKPLPEKLRIRWVESRAQARDFIGFKHINGPFKWDALAKAKYAASWFQEGGDIASISRTLGDNHNTVRRLVNGWFVLQQALADGFNLDQISKKNFAFSHLYTALTRSSVRELLGLNAEDLSTPPKPNPVPQEHRKDLEVLMSWLYGQDQKKEPTLIQSQNPNLNQLSSVLSHPEAKSMLVATRDLQKAYERVEPPSSRFEDALMVTARQGEELMGLAGFYEGEPTLMSVAEGLLKTVRSLLVVMRDKRHAKNDQE